MPLNDFSEVMLPAVETTLKTITANANGQGLDELHTMLAYHLGWEGEGTGSAASGKRIRPLLLLLVTAAAGGSWESSLPAAAAVELVHNFSLIHDDIEDNSPLRRGRLTVWKKWGIAQAINTGDSMFTLAHIALSGLEETCSPQAALQAARIFHQTCLALTQGQYLDIAYELRGDLTMQAYWPMVTGKTAALLSGCTEIGAIVAGANDPIRQAYREFGHYLGLAFQALDDLLGIWGDSALTGKSADSDLLSGKKCLPVLYGLEQQGSFAQRWRKGPIQAEEVAELAKLLELEGAREYTQETAACLTDKALSALASAEPSGEAGQALQALAAMLLKRQV